MTKTCKVNISFDCSKPSYGGCVCSCSLRVWRSANPFILISMDGGKKGKKRKSRASCTEVTRPQSTVIHSLFCFLFSTSPLSTFFSSLNHPPPPSSSPHPLPLLLTCSYQPFVSFVGERWSGNGRKSSSAGPSDRSISA